MIQSETIGKTKIEVLARGLKFPEGPAFIADGSLWAGELEGGNLVCYNDGRLNRFHVGGAPNGIAIDHIGILWFCDAAQGSIRCFNTLNQHLETIVTHVGSEALSRPNDLAFDKIGNLVFTCPGISRKEPTGYACVLMKDGTVKRITEGKYFPNGLSFTSDGNSLIIAETYRHRLWKGGWNAEKGEWTEPSIWCEVGGPDGPGGPDGMAMGTDCRLYVAVFGTGKIRVVNDGGQVESEISLPGLNPTNCAFTPGGNLIVTETSRGELLQIKLLTD